MAKAKIFVVEDDEWYSEFLTYNLSLNPDFDVEKFDSGKACLEALHQKPDIITLDYKLPDMPGEKVLAKIKDYNPEIEVMVVSEQESIETAVELLKSGAYDYIVKSKDIRDRLLNVANNIVKQSGLKKQVAALQEEVEQKYDFTKSIIGNSPAIKKVFNLMDKAINTNIVVTITGETGTGKELVAKAIHFNSQKKKLPFIPVNMAAIPRELIESELFGHEKGSFTGATSSRTGKFEEAGKGTIFLDEIGELDQTLQAKLLRVLQEREITRVGSNKPVKIDCRVMVATNRNLQAEVKKGNFRDDLYFRLFGLTIHLPPLRERENDIILLAEYFLENACKENEIEKKNLPRESKKKLLAYNYPGNVRELKSVIELAAVMANDTEIDPEDITFGTQHEDNVSNVNEDLTLREHTRKIIKSYLRKYDNNVKLAAEKLDIGFSTIYRMLKEENNR